MLCMYNDTLETAVGQARVHSKLSHSHELLYAVYIISHTPAPVKRQLVQLFGNFGKKRRAGMGRFRYPAGAQTWIYAIPVGACIARPQQAVSDFRNGRSKPLPYGGAK